MLPAEGAGAVVNTRNSVMDWGDFAGQRGNVYELHSSNIILQRKWALLVYPLSPRSVIVASFSNQ
jgi:hypothetical protein